MTTTSGPSAEEVADYNVQRRLFKRVLGRVEYELNSGCWLWPGPITRDGYGKTNAASGRRARKTFRLHIVSWRVNRGPIPAGLLVLHKCDTRPCFNPDHLFLGTHADNMKDASRKGRLPRRGGPRLSKAMRLDIARACESASMHAVSRQFGVHRGAVRYWRDRLSNTEATQ